ncbi:IstB-like ATP binding protein [Salipiger profundus]|nr:IstB-like ATP binding protein [Salipiger profundus]
MSMTVETATLPTLLTALRLPTVARLWPEFCTRADKEGWPAERLLAALCELELSEREQRRIQRHLAAESLPQGKTLDAFDFLAVPTLSQARVRALVEGDSWLQAGHNLLAFGPPGSGKTHLAGAIGYELIQRGYRVLMARTSDLVQHLQVARQAVPAFHIARRIVASFRLTATMAFFMQVLFAIRRPHALSGDRMRTLPRIAAAASKSIVRTRPSPALVMRPTMSVFPDCHLRGVNPSHAPTSRDRGKRSGSSTALRKLKATMTPTPGIVIRSRVTGSDFASAVSWPSMLPSSLSSRVRTRSIASTIPSRISWPWARSRARPAHAFRVTEPIFSPKFRSAARREFSVALIFSTRKVRVVSSARVSWASRDFTWTRLNQPRRTRWAMPRASWRSVFTRIAAKAARTWRASITETEKPSLTSPSYSHCERFPVSSPTCSMRRP